jgi:hypothetical protein
MSVAGRDARQRDQTRRHEPEQRPGQQPAGKANPRRNRQRAQEALPGRLTLGGDAHAELEEGDGEERKPGKGCDQQRGVAILPRRDEQ